MAVNKTDQGQTTASEAIVPLRSPKQAPSAPKPGQTHIEAIKKIRTTPRPDSMLSCRYELKYRIREGKARAIARYIQSYINPDQYSRKCPDFAYPISSLYFDSDGLHLAKETIEQKTNRFKLRVRCYDDKPESPCFFEIKRRLNNVILKDRARVQKTDFARIIREGYIPEKLYKKDRDTLMQFQFYVRTLQARPIALIRYMRQAFEDDSCNRVRITFDRQLSYRTTQDPIATTNGPDWFDVPMDFVILEIKFTNRYPAWLSAMVKMFDLYQTAMSKYVSCVQQSCSLGFCGPRYMVGV